MTSSNLDGSLVGAKFDSTGAITALTLTDGGKTYLSSSAWYQTLTNFQNGFETEFTMNIANIQCRVQSCAVMAMGICTYYNKASCGGDGFAFVMQASDKKFKGGSGSGLGYANVMNSISVEFDTVFNKDKNDPDITLERHVSLMVVNGQNLGDEANSYARNENPLNFKNSESSNFISKPTIKIQYLNKNVRVFINNVLQIGYYNQLLLSSVFSSIASGVWIGITAATSTVSAKYEINSWALRMVIPSIAKSVAQLTNPTVQIKSKDDFTIDIVLKDECGNVYVPVAGFDDISQALFDKTTIADCDLRDKSAGTDGTYAYRFKFNCANVGLHTFSFSYQNLAITPMQVNILPGTFSRAVLTFPYGTQGNIDTGLQFVFTPYDFSKNVVDISQDTVLSKLSIFFPNAANSVKSFTFTKQTDKTFLVKFTSDLIGNYYIQDNIYILDQSLGRYDFNLVEGAFVATNSFAKFYEGNVNVDVNTANELTRTQIPAGTQLTLKIVYKDRVGNMISSSRISVSDMSNLEFIDGNSNALIDMRPGAKLYYTFVNVYKAGVYSVKCLLQNQGIACSNCNFQVLPLAADFTHSSLFQYDFGVGKYNTLILDSFVLVKPQVFNFKLLLRDIYDNIVNVPNVKTFNATLQGNYMKVLTLILSNVEDGVKLEVGSGDLDYFQNLVGRKNYNITVVQIATQAYKNWTLEIKSDGSDNDASNADVDLTRTTFAWADLTSISKGAIAGTSYRAIITLRTKENSLRYNGWIPETSIITALTLMNATQGETVSAAKKGTLKGTYYVDMLTIVVTSKINSLTAKVLTMTKTLNFKTIASVGFQGIIDASALKDKINLNDGTVNKQYNFTFRTYDKYLNPQDVDATNLVIFSQDDNTVSFPVAATRVDVGIYSCLVTPSFPGKYAVQSIFISNGGNSYLVYFRRGLPSAKTSVATIVEDVSLGKVAGSTVTLKIQTKDDSGLSLTQDEVKNSLSGFLANVKEPNLDSYTNIPLLSVQTNGDILATVTLTRAGQNVFSASFNNSALLCAICSVNVFAGNVDLTKISMYYLSISTAGNVENPLSATTSYMIDNTQVDPIFLMRFSDSFGNKRNYSSDLSFTGALNVPSGAQKVYNLVTKGWNDAISFKISDAQFKYFQSELKNPNCTGVFRAISSVTKLTGEVNDKIFLTGGANDSIYSNDDIDPTVSKVTPVSLSFVAADWVDASIELRVKSGLLYNHPLTFGWYDDIQNSFKLTLTDGNQITPGITPGKLKGTYNLHFTCYKSYINGINMTVSYRDPKDPTNSTFIPLTTKVTIFVSPSKLYSLRLDNPALIVDGIAGDTKALTFYPYDFFKNLIPKLSLTAMNFVIASSANENIVPNIIQNADGGVVVKFSVLKVSTIVITSLRFMDANGVVVNNYTYNIGPATVNSLHSIATLDKDSMNAGDLVRWKIYPRDQYDNYVPVSQAVAALFSASRAEPGSTAVIPILDDPLISIEDAGNCYYWQRK